MTQIKSLTSQQKALLTTYRDKWMTIGLGTGPSNRLKTEDAIRRAYKITSLNEPKQIIWSTSPIAGWILVCVLKNDELMKKIYKDYQKLGASVGESVWDSVGESVWDSVGESVWESVWDSVWDSVRASVGDSVRASVGDSVRASVWASVRDSVWASVRDSVRDSVGESVRDSVWASVRDSVGDSVKNFDYSQTCFGSHDANWLGFYNYFLEVLKLESCEKLIPLMDLAQEGGWFYPYKNVCVITERPLEINLKNGRIHKDGGPAIRYSDGFSVWGLNGIRVPQILAETDANKLNGKDALKEKNVEIRREYLRKIGMDKFISDVGAECIDKWNGYELLMVDIGLSEKKPYLRMRNPSVNLEHVEGIQVGIKTCKEALLWRNQMDIWVNPMAQT